jgi:hypothetical protein
MTPAGGPAPSTWTPTTTLVTAISHSLPVKTDVANKIVTVVMNTVPMLVPSSCPACAGALVVSVGGAVMRPEGVTAAP